MSKLDSQTAKVSQTKRSDGDKQTPLMAQYLRIKEANPDTILLFRVVNFIEILDKVYS